jgi:hypothetical protein
MVSTTFLAIFFTNSSGVDVKMTIFCDFSIEIGVDFYGVFPIFGEKIGVFLKYQ